jgi:hypothetical protein
VITSNEKTQRTEIVNIRKEWKILWKNQIDDKVRAEGIADKTYSLLFVEQGTIIKATRDYEALELKEILRLHKVQNIEHGLGPHPSVGGYTKFAKQVLNKQARNRSLSEELSIQKVQKNSLPKNSGRGWLHL